jgi:hypothetical protein
MIDILWPAVTIGISGLIVVIGILFTLKRLRDKKSGFPAQDERTQKINGIAATYALYIGQFFIAAYLLIDIIGREFFGMLEIGAGYPMIVSLLVFSMSFLVLRWYASKKGEL